jgi:hypothetical protein
MSAFNGWIVHRRLWFQYLLFAAGDYETVAFRIQTKPIDKGQHFVGCTTLECTDTKSLLLTLHFMEPATRKGKISFPNFPRFYSTNIARSQLLLLSKPLKRLQDTGSAVHHGRDGKSLICCLNKYSPTGEYGICPEKL